MTRRPEDRAQLVEKGTESTSFRVQCRSCGVTMAVVAIGIVLVSLVIYGLLMSLRTKPHSSDLDAGDDLNETTITNSPPLRLVDLTASQMSKRVKGNVDTSTSSQLNGECGDTAFGYFMLTIYWPSSYCSTQHCFKVPSKWVIHGLWPNYWNHTWPEYCCELDFDESTVSSILPSLESNWPGLISVEEDSLWEHEWKKHGTCCYNNKRVGGEFKYFSETLKLYFQYPVQTWLEKASIVPSNSKFYKPEKIQKIVTNAFGNQIAIDCIKDHKSNKSMLDSIYLCFDRITFKPINCPYRGQTNCPSEVMYPEL